METRGQMDQKPLISQTERKTSQVELSFEQLLKKREEGDAPLGVATQCEERKRAGVGWGPRASPQQQPALQPLSTWFPTPYPPLNCTPIKSFVQSHSAY